jgi:methionyl aminopeptidase
MIYYKTGSEIEIMKKSGDISSAAMREIAKNIRPGIKTTVLDRIAQETIEKLGGESSFKKVENYFHTTCITPNDWVVHGVPGDYILKEGDLVGVDLGAYYKGFHTDMAQTFAVGNVSAEKKKFLETGKKALSQALGEVKEGNHIGDISSRIQTSVEGGGYSVVRELIGHGVGKELHEGPLIPGIGKKGTGEKIARGLVIAVEVIYNFGKPEVKLLADGWSISTKDGSVSGLFERTIAITEKGPEVLTPFAKATEGQTPLR